MVCPRGVPIKIERCMTEKDLTRAIRYGAHSSATKKTTYIPPELGKSEKLLAGRENSVGFSQACVEASAPHKPNQLPPNPHPATALLDHMRVHGVPIKIE